MTRAYIYWRENDFTSAEREFRASAEFCSETTVWRLHAAHVLFMRGDKYKEAAAFYEPIVRQSYEDVRSSTFPILILQDETFFLNFRFFQFLQSFLQTSASHTS
jgi:tetratricopeptide repeat protein 30